jgi:hypothetical protein
MPEPGVSLVYLGKNDGDRRCRVIKNNLQDYRRQCACLKEGLPVFFRYAVEKTILNRMDSHQELTNNQGWVRVLEWQEPNSPVLHRRFPKPHNT